MSYVAYIFDSLSLLFQTKYRKNILFHENLHENNLEQATDLCQSLSTI